MTTGSIAVVNQTQGADVGTDSGSLPEPPGTWTAAMEP